MVQMETKFNFSFLFKDEEESLMNLNNKHTVSYNNGEIERQWGRKQGLLYWKIGSKERASPRFQPPWRKGTQMDSFLHGRLVLLCVEKKSKSQQMMRMQCMNSIIRISLIMWFNILWLPSSMKENSLEPPNCEPPCVCLSVWWFRVRLNAGEKHKIMSIAWKWSQYLRKRESLQEEEQAGWMWVILVAAAAAVVAAAALRLLLLPI